MLCRRYICFIASGGGQLRGEGTWKRIEHRPGGTQGPRAREGLPPARPPSPLPSLRPQGCRRGSHVGACGWVSRKLEASRIFSAMLGHFPKRFAKLT